MSIEGQHRQAGDGATRLPWFEGAPVPGSPPLYAFVLDLDDDLAEELDLRMRLAARQLATARVLHAGTGVCRLDTWLDAAGHGPGLLILEGLVTFETRIADRAVIELIGAGDLIQPVGSRQDDMIDRAETWRALQPTRLALLDDEFTQRVLPWPQLAQALLRRAERRAEDLATLRAISCQPRLEARLVLLLWHLAARWGRVERTGIRLRLPLTHRLLGQLVSAERPSVSHALHRLAESGLVTGTAGDWHLHGQVDEHVESLIERTARLPSSNQDAARGAASGR